MNIQPVIDQIVSKDPQERIQGLGLLAESMLDIALDDIGLVMDALRSTLKDNNFKVCEASLSFLCAFLEHVDAKIFQPYFNDYVNLLMERFGDSKTSVRDKAFEAIIQIGKHFTAKDTLEAIREGFIHKSWKVREGVCMSFVEVLQHFGPKSIPLNRFLPDIVSLLDDSTASVRDAAVTAVCEIYRYVGVDLIQELGTYKIRVAQMKAIEDRASEIEVDVENLVSLKPKNLKSPLKPKARHTIHTISTASNGKTNSTVDCENDDVDVQPAYIKENDLPREIEAINETLQDVRNGDWKKRLNAIRRLRGLTYGGVTDFSTFTSEFSRLKDAISKQVVDLRSTIVKEACILLNLLAKTLGSRFESFSDYFVPILLKSTVVTVQVISDSVNNCIRTLIIHGKLNKGVSLLTERICDSKTHVTMRGRCAEYLVLVLQHVDYSILSKTMDELTKAIKASVTDASAAARQAGRQAFVIFKDSFPERANRLFMELDPSTQKKLTGDKNGQISPRGSTASSMSIHSMASATSSVSSAVSSTSSIRRTRSAIPRKIGKMSEEVEIVSKKTVKPSVPMTTTYPSSPKKNLSIKVQPGKKTQSTSPISPSSPSKPKTAPQPLRSSMQISKLDVSTNSDPMDTSGDLDVSMESVNAIVRESRSLDWKTKVQVFEKMEIILDSSRISEVKSTFLPVINLYIDRLSDSNQNVVDKALSSSMKLIEKLPECVEPYLERILSKLFLLLTEDNTKILSEKLLTKIGNSYSGDILLPRLFKIVDTYNSRIRVACLEFLMHIVQSSSAYLSFPAHMKSSIKKTISLFQQNTSKTCEPVLTSIMVSLYTVQPKVFLEQILSLPSVEQNPIKNILRENVPDFDNNLSSLTMKSPQTNLTPLTVSKPTSPVPKPRTTSTKSNIENMVVLPSRIEKLKSTKSMDAYETKSVDELSAILSAISKYKVEKNTHQVYRCIFDISELARQKPPSESIWVVSFAKLLFYMFDLFLDEDEIVREKSLMCVHSLLRYQTEHCSKFADITFRKIIEKLNDSAPAVQRTAERVAEQFIESVEPTKTLELIKPQIINNSEKDVVLLGGIRLLAKLLKLVTPDILITHVPSILPGIFEAFKHTNVDIRKSVVYLLVDLHFSLGDAFAPYLKRLSSEQQKLIQIYTKKSEAALIK